MRRLALSSLESSLGVSLRGLVNEAVASAKSLAMQALLSMWTVAMPMVRCHLASLAVRLRLTVSRTRLNCGHTTVRPFSQANSFSECSVCMIISAISMLPGVSSVILLLPCSPVSSATSTFTTPLAAPGVFVACMIMRLVFLRFFFFLGARHNESKPRLREGVFVGVLGGSFSLHVTSAMSSGTAIALVVAISGWHTTASPAMRLVLQNLVSAFAWTLPGAEARCEPTPCGCTCDLWKDTCLRGTNFWQNMDIGLKLQGFELVLVTSSSRSMQSVASLNVRSDLSSTGLRSRRGTWKTVA
mmetsp:Transcript_18673/g.26029  ORF Transcript_18673/g.26029 Transcript_18673/m.26029 type:complete len:300 (+) Transcript_18673:153-1052(+)